MWWEWLKRQVEERAKALPPFVRIAVTVKTRDGRTFPPFSIGWEGNALILSENEEGEERTPPAVIRENLRKALGDASAADDWHKYGEGYGDLRRAVEKAIDALDDWRA